VGTRGSGVSPFVRLYGYSVRAGVSIGMAIGSLTGIVVGALAGSLGAALLAGLAGFFIGGLYALLPSVVGSFLVVAVARRSCHVRRDLAITIAVIVGVLDAVSLILDPHTWPGVLLSNVVMAPMLWWAWRYLARTAQAAV
jgi:hypothetical protein